MSTQSEDHGAEYEDHGAEYEVAKTMHCNAHFCPISKEVMLDPVITVDGHSYERECIERWFGLGYTTSPKTNADLDDTSLTPNHTLKSAIQDCILNPMPPANPNWNCICRCCELVVMAVSVITIYACLVIIFKS